MNEADANLLPSQNLEQNPDGLKSDETVLPAAKPFEGIEYFEAIDEEKVEAVEVGSVGSLDWRRYEFYPRTGEFRALVAQPGRGDSIDISKWEYNYRTNFGWAPHGSLRDKDFDFINDSRQLLESRGIDTRTPSGYPEVKEVIRAAQEHGELPFGEMKPGNLYLVFSRFDNVVFRYDHQTQEEFGRSEDIVRLYRQPDTLFGRRNHLKLNDRGEPSLPFSDSEQVLGFSVRKEKSWRDEYDKPTTIFELTEEQARRIAGLRPAEKDPHVGSEWSRERICIFAGLQGLQYERWGKDEVNSTRYDQVNRENYHLALQEMIRRFGSEAFANQAEQILLGHLATLHTDKHLPGSPYKPHSDISPLPEDYMQIAKAVTGGKHPLPEDMSESGHWVNAKSLFGDADFWNFLRLHQTGMFHRFVDYLQSLPKDFLQGTYARAKVDPVALIKQYYPDAYKEITLLRPDFNSDTPEAILIQPDQEEK